ncbi:MAG: HEAT repeat domain-containing protein [Methanothrix sp.]
MLCTSAFGQTTATDWIKRAENLTSYSTKSSVTQTLKLFTSEKVTTVTETTETVAVLNLSSLEAHASRLTKNQMEMPGQPAKTNTTYVDFYQIGNSTYKKNEIGNWTHLVDPRPEQDVWEGMDENNLVKVIAKMFNQSKTEDLGSEAVNGVDAYKFKIVTGIRDYINLYNTSFAIAAKVTQYPMYLPSVNRTELNETGKMEKTIWISKKSYLPVKYQSLMSFSMTPEIKGAIDPNTGQMKMFNQSIRMGEISFAIDISDLYYDFNKKVDITPPKEALMDWNDQGIALYNQGKYDEAIRLDQVAADVDKMIRNLNDTSPSVREAAVETLKELNDTRAVEPLIQALKDENSSVRAGAAWALGNLGDTRAVGLLIQALKDENMSVRWVAAVSLGQLRDTRAVGPLILALNDPESYVRCRAAESLGKLNDIRAVEPMILVLNNKDLKVRWWAAESLGKLNDSRAVGPLIQALKDEDRDVRAEAAWALGKLNDSRAVKPLILALKDTYYWVRRNAAESLGEFNDSRAVEPLILALNDEDSDGRWRVAESLGKLNDIRAVEPLILALNDEVSEVQQHAAESLGKLNDIRAVEPLILALNDDDSEVQQHAAESLSKLNDIRAVEPLILALKDECSSVRWIAAWSLGNLGDTRAIEPLKSALNDENEAVREAAADALTIRLDPNYVDAWYNKGLALSGQGKYDEAIKCYDEVIRLIPNDAGGWNNKDITLEAFQVPICQ